MPARQLFPALPEAPALSASDITDLGTVTLRGDIRSFQWDGGSDLTGGADAEATVGFLLDSSAGAAQFQEIFAEGGVFSGELEIAGNAEVIRVKSDQVLVISDGMGTDLFADSYIEFDGDWGDGDIAFPAYIAAEVDNAIGAGTGLYIAGPNDGSSMFDGAVISLQWRTDDATGLTFRANHMIASALDAAGDPGVGFAVDGINASVSLGSTLGGDEIQLNADQVLLFADGSAAAPVLSWRNDPDTGIYRVGPNTLGFATGGAAAATLESNGRFRVVNGSAAAPALSFTNDPDTGIFRIGTNTIGFATAGTNRIVVQAGNYSNAPIRDSTTGDAANVAINATSGQMFRSTSALKYKRRVTTNVDYLADVDLVPTKHYRPDDKRWRYSLIADWLADQDPLLAVFDDDGEVEGYDTSAVLAVLAAKVRRLETA